MNKIYTAYNRIFSVRAALVAAFVVAGIAANAQYIPPYEPAAANNSTATASVLPTGPVKMRGYIFPAGDIDYYSFTANAGDKVYAAVQTSFSAGNSTDCQLTLIASDGTTTIEFDDDNGSFAALSSTIAGATIPTSGTYYLKVNDFTAGTGSERPYDLYLQVQSGSPTAEVEPNDAPATANAVPANGWITGSRDPATLTEQDWYSITLAAGESVFLSLDLDPERDGTTWNGRLGFGLFGDAGNQILVIDDAGTGDVSPDPNRPSEALFFTAKDAGTYYVFVDAASAATGGPAATYSLSVTKFAATSGYVSYVYGGAATAIPTPGSITSTITIPDSKIIKDLSVRINATHAVMADMDVVLTSPQGNTVHLFTDIGATATGGQTQMDLVLNDHNGVPPAFTVMKGVAYQPELAAHLDYFKGINAAGTWTLTIYDDATLNSGTLNGWAIDVLQDTLATQLASYTTLYSTDFEANDGGFTHSGTADEWEWGTPATVATSTANPVAAFNTAFSGAKCWKTDLDNTYNVSSSQTLESPAIDLTAQTGTMELSWAMKYQMESATFDQLSVTVEEVGGSGLTKEIFRWYGATMAVTAGNPTVNVPLSAGWGLYHASISEFAGKTIKFKTQLVSDNTTNFAGVAIDDVKVSLLCPTITLSPASLPDGTAGTAYSQTITQSGSSNATLNYGVTAGALPSGLTLNPDGTLVGTPDATGTFNFTVTVTDGNSCTGAQAYSITVNCPTPTTALTLTPNPICNYGAPVTLAGGTPAGGIYSGTGVSNGSFDPAAGTQTITYTYTDIYGCISSDDDILTVNQPPVVNLGGPYTQCGGTVTLNATVAGATYAWSNSSTTATISVSSTGTYSVTVTDANTCTATAQASVTINPLPTATVSGTTELCSGATGSLTVNTAATGYAWNDGQTTSTISINTPGVYVVTVTDGNGCTVAAFQNVSALGNFTANNSLQAGDFQLPGPRLFRDENVTDCSSTKSCPGTSGSSGYFFDAYEVINNSSSDVCATADITATCGPNFFLSYYTGTFNPADVCQNYAGDIGASNPGTYNFVVPANGNTILVVNATTPNSACAGYTLQVSGLDLVQITPSGTTNFCSGSSVDLDASGGTTYTWNTGATTSTITVTETGTYTVSATNANGCDVSTSQDVTVFATAPPTNVNGYSLCEGSTIPSGQGLTATPGLIPTTQTIDFDITNPVVNEGETPPGVTIATINLPGLPAGSVVTGATVTINRITLQGFSYASEVRLQLSGAINNAGTAIATTDDIPNPFDGSFTIPAASIPTSAGVATLSYYEDFDDDNGGPDALFPVVGTLVIEYNTPGNLVWYDQSIGGSVVGNGSPVDPLAGVPASTSATYYVENTLGVCQSVRVPALLNVFSRPVVDLGGPYAQCGGNVVLDAGNPGDTYAWSTGATTKTIIVTSTGNYTVTVTNEPGCTAASTANVTINALPAVNLGGPYVQCQGTVTLDAGNAGSTYLWNDNSTNQTLAAGATGTYSVTVTDVNGCTGEASADVQIDMPPLNTTGYTLCQGETVPSGAGFTASGCGDAASSFAGRITLSDPVFNRSQTGTTYSASAIGTATHYAKHLFTVSATGAYTFTLCGNYDAYLHIYHDTFNTSFPATNFIVADDDAAICTGGSEATVNLTAGVQYIFVATGFANNNVGDYTVTFSGAGAVYEGALNPVLWFSQSSGGPLVGTGSPFNPVGTATLPNTNTPGTYTFYVACPSTPYCRTAVDFVVNPSPVVNIGGPYNQCGGTVALDAGNPGLTFAWSDGTNAQTTTASTSGTYTVTVTNSFSCSTEDAAEVYIQPLPVVNLGIDQAQCGGSVTLDAGYPGNTYLWSDNSTGQTLTVTTTGTYAVTVTDINSGCTGSDDVNVTFYTFPVVNLGPDHTQCGGTVTLDAGNAGATYLWSNGATTQTTTVGATGTYRVTVTNATGCTATGSVNVTINSFPVLGADQADSVCPGYTVNLNDYYANTYATYVWNTANPTAVGAGSYQLIVTNAAGCADTANVTITNRQKPNLGADVVDSVCVGYTYDLWSVFPNSANYTSYVWNTPTPQEVTPGTYTLIVTNASGCMDTVNATITTRQQPVLGADVVDSVCIGYTLDLTTYFPDNSYASYTWNTPNPDSVGAGIYTLIVSNASGCYDTAQVTITWRQQPVVTLTMNSAICYTEPAFTLTGGAPVGGTYNVGDSLNVTTFNPVVFGVGTHHITYIFTNASGCTDSASVNFTVNPQPQIDTVEQPDLCSGSAPMNLDSFFTPLGGVYSGFGVSQHYFYPALTGAGSFTVNYLYTDANGCKDTLDYPIVVKNSVSVSLTVSEVDYTICQGDYVLFTASGAEFYEFFVNGISQGAASTTDTFATTTLATHDEVVVIGSNSCSADTSEGIIIDVITLPTVNAGPDTTITLGQSVMIHTTSTGSSQLLYNWTPDYFLNFTNVPNPTYSGPDTTEFVVKVTDTWGCWATDTIVINVYVPDNILLPNVITANGDGKNDIWKLNAKINLDGSDLIIFNRWGELVYEATNYTNDWDGTYKGTGKKLPDGTYYYVLKVPAQNNHVYKGAINILNSDAK